MPAVALTDHGNLFGAVTFYEACRKHGVKPILGVEAYVAPGDLSQIRDAQGFLPRFLNMRLILENNTAVSPAVSPFLDGMAITYRMAPRQP